jgi:AcrR family transcriptional regulator
MTQALRTNPRKSASQDRSRATVDALLEATARILIREGYDKASTNRIPEDAGVSVGSLYQYIPGKEALVAALNDRHNQQTMAAVGTELQAALTLPLERAVRKLVAAAVTAHRVDPKLHRVLAEQIPRVGRLEKIEGFSRRYRMLFRAYLERAQVRAPDLDLVAFICVTTIEALTHRAVLHEKLASDAATDALIDEATRLVAGYLKRGRYLPDGGFNRTLPARPGLK